MTSGPGEAPSGTVPPPRSARFDLPVGELSPGRSQPKRTPPKRRDTNAHLLRRAAMGAATFAVSLAITTVAYRLLVSPDFGDAALENGTTAAIALLIGCFTLPTGRRRDLPLMSNLLVCLLFLALTPWAYQLGNDMDARGNDLANGFNFLFEVLLAVVMYRLAARFSANGREAS